MTQSLEELLAAAETAKEPPLDPVSGIPKQKLPSWVRIGLKIFFLPFLHLDLAMQKIAKKIIRPPFQQVGSCKRRGNCCHYILLPETKGIWGKLFYFWHTEVNGFYLREGLDAEWEKEKVLVMGCRYLRKDGLCSQHILRPMVCRKWPIVEHFGKPRILKGCGYRVVVRPKAIKKYPSLHVYQDAD